MSPQFSMSLASFLEFSRLSGLLCVVMLTGAPLLVQAISDTGACSSPLVTQISSALLGIIFSFSGEGEKSATFRECFGDPESFLFSFTTSEVGTKLWSTFGETRQPLISFGDCTTLSTQLSIGVIMLFVAEMSGLSPSCTKPSPSVG
uniref:Uncharacterized protein n=1 Tax=Pyxicephalus adspersus TaxID=30357 RepID=A0AAV3APQ7_PYXAD|nr:TPA: hypothetical protein GDO54_009703 [Pyxicephalus adspersus]